MKILPVSISRLLHMQTSPADFIWACENRSTDTKSKALGRLAHTLILEPHKLDSHYIASKYAEYRTNEAKAWRDSQQEKGLTIYTENDLATAKACAKSAINNGNFADLLERLDTSVEGETEWIDEDSGLACHGRYDLVADGEIWDVKLTKAIEPESFFKEVIKYQYHVKMAWYMDGLNAQGYCVDTAGLMAIRNTAPHISVGYCLPASLLEEGRRVYKQLLKKLAECIEMDYWPGIKDDGFMVLPVPNWFLNAVNSRNMEE